MTNDKGEILKKHRKAELGPLLDTDRILHLQLFGPRN